MTRRRWYLLLAFVFAIHNLEEGLAAPRMVELLQTRGPSFLGALYAGVDADGLRAGLVILSAAGFVLALAAGRTPEAAGAAYAMIVFAAVIGINALAHSALSLLYESSMPGLLTAVLLTGPAAVAVLVRARQETWIGAAAWWTVLPAAALIHGPLLAVLINQS